MPHIVWKRAERVQVLKAYNGASPELSEKERMTAAQAALPEDRQRVIQSDSQAKNILATLKRAAALKRAANGARRRAAIPVAEEVSEVAVKQTRAGLEMSAEHFAATYKHLKPGRYTVVVK